MIKMFMSQQIIDQINSKIFGIYEVIVDKIFVKWDF